MMAFSVYISPLLLMALSVVSLNAIGLPSGDKPAGVLQWRQSLPVTVDVVLLQETYCSSMVECEAWFRGSGFLCVGSFGMVRSCGSLILHRPCFTVSQSWSDLEGRFVMAESLLGLLF